MSTVHLRVLLAVAVSVITLLVVVAVQAKPVWQPDLTLYGSDARHLNAFGYALAIDQDTLAVASGVGVFVFEHSGSTWVERAKLLPDDMQRVSGNFGRSVAISGDTIAVSAPTAMPNVAHVDGVSGTGAVYIFTREGATWKQQAKLFPPQPKGGFHFGYSMALDHNTLVVGQQGEPHVFERDPATATWSYATNLVIPQSLDPGSGRSFTKLATPVAISGNTILVGGTSSLSNSAAVAILFERQPQTSTWTYKQELPFPLPPKAFGGIGGVALQGNTLLVGAPLDGPFFIGSAYIAKRPTASNEWRQTAKLAPRYIHRPAGLLGLLIDYGFGNRVALKDDYAVVAAVGQQSNFMGRNDEGEAFLFHRQPNSEHWSQLAKLVPRSDRKEFLPTVSLSSRYVVVGDPKALNAQGERTGAVYLFALPQTAP